MNTKIDHAGFTIKGFREIAGHDDSRPFQCKICYNGKVVAEAWDDGWGGQMNFVWKDERANEIWDAHIKTLPRYKFTTTGDIASPIDVDLEYDSDLFLNDIIEDFEFKKKVKSLCKKNIVMSYPDDEPYSYRFMKLHNEPFSDRIKQILLNSKRFPEGTIFWNEVFA